MKKSKNLSDVKNAALLILMLGCTWPAYAGIVKGTIKDKQHNEPLAGATVVISENSNGAGTENSNGATADIDGNYTLELPAGSYTMTVRYTGYKTITEDSVEVPEKGEITLDFLMNGDSQTLGEVSVTAVARRNTETAQVQEQKRSLVMQTGVSAQQIARTQNKDASEVIRRVPGVSIIDENSVMVRGLSQRYNNVWLNGAVDGARSTPE